MIVHKTLAGAALAAGLAACATAPPPAAPGDSCAFLAERDAWWDALQRAERRWGAPPALVLAIIRQESGFQAEAKPAREDGFLFFPGKRPSSAFGYAQAINTTWEAYQRESGETGADRAAFRDAADFVAWYARKSKDRLGLDWSDAHSHYLAYHEGHGGFARGSFEGDKALLRVAERVAGYHDAYARQIGRCGDDLEGWWPFW